MFVFEQRLEHLPSKIKSLIAAVHKIPIMTIKVQNSKVLNAFILLDYSVLICIWQFKYYNHHRIIIPYIPEFKIQNMS